MDAEIEFYGHLSRLVSVKHPSLDIPVSQPCEAMIMSMKISRCPVWGVQSDYYVNADENPQR